MRNVGLQFMNGGKMIGWGDVRGPLPRPGDTVRLPGGTYDVVGVTHEFGRGSDGESFLSRVAIEIQPT